MFKHFKLRTLLFPALLWANCYGWFNLFEECYKPFPKFANPSDVDSKKITDDINGFYKNFDERFKDLERFIKQNISHADDLDVNFFLYTPKNRDKPDHLHRQSLNKSNFNPELLVKVLVHGLTPTKNFSDGAIASLKHALLVKGDYNVIILDYRSITEMPYTTAVKYSFLVAKNAADNLKFLLKTFKLTTKRLHLIGVGFGGQLVGNIGYYIPGLARITALDPAGALFERFPPHYRTSPDDANFVDVVHTTGEKYPKGLGFPRPTGDQDFFPNGGKKQPGCKENITAQMAGSQDAADFKNALCSHKRSIELFIESVCDWLCSFVGFVGNKCDSYEDYENWHCLFFNSKTATMGFYAEKDNNIKKHSKFYLNTNANYPYCSFFS